MVHCDDDGDYYYVEFLEFDVFGRGGVLSTSTISAFGSSSPIDGFRNGDQSLFLLQFSKNLPECLGLGLRDFEWDFKYVFWYAEVHEICTTGTSINNGIYAQSLYTDITFVFVGVCTKIACRGAIVVLCDE